MFQRTVLLLVGLLACCLCPLEAAQCMPDQTNPCVARCNGTTFDISKVFDYPVNITEKGPRSDSNGRIYWYMWDPCKGYQCPDLAPGADCAICQKSDVFWSCGKTTQPIFLWDSYASSKPVVDFPSWSIQYPFGSYWRWSKFTFIVDDKQEEPTVKFVSEDPNLQYNFEVRGKCIGQDTFECRKKYIVDETPLTQKELLCNRLKKRPAWAFLFTIFCR